MKGRLRNHRIIKCELISASMGLDCDDGWVEKSGLKLKGIQKFHGARKKAGN